MAPCVPAHQHTLTQGRLQVGDLMQEAQDIHSPVILTTQLGSLLTAPHFYQ